MNLQEHYATYCASLGRDMLAEAALYAKVTPTKDRSLHRTIHEYLVDLVVTIRASIENKDATTYKKMLRNHQFAMTMLFGRMVREMLEDTDLQDGLTYFYLARDLGWNWFKFAGIRCLEFKLKNGPVSEVRVVPSYTEDNAPYCDPGTNYIDADEAGYLSTVSPKEVEQFFYEKRGHTTGSLKFIGHMDGGVPLFTTVDRFNHPERVMDWSLPLEGSCA